MVIYWLISSLDLGQKCFTDGVQWLSWFKHALMTSQDDQGEEQEHKEKHHTLHNMAVDEPLK